MPEPGLLVGDPGASGMWAGGPDDIVRRCARCYSCGHVVVVEFSNGIFIAVAVVLGVGRPLQRPVRELQEAKSVVGLARENCALRRRDAGR